MTVENVMRALWWIPNAVSYFRGLFVAPLVGIVFLWEFFAHITTTAFQPEMLGNYKALMFWLVVAAALSDWLDGFLAKTFKNYGWQTKQGGEIDAFCDKFLGIAVLYIAIPFHYRLDWYLIAYLPALYYIAYYSHTTTQMRWKRQITKPNRMAQWKTCILMVVKVVGFFDIAYADNVAIIWACTIATVGAAVMCLFALQRYKETATQTAPAE